MQLYSLEETVQISECVISFHDFASAVISEKAQGYIIANEDIAYDVISREYLQLFTPDWPRCESSRAVEWQVNFETKCKLFLMLPENYLEVSLFCWFIFSLKPVSFWSATLIQLGFNVELSGIQPIYACHCNYISQKSTHTQLSLQQDFSSLSSWFSFHRN